MNDSLKSLGDRLRTLRTRHGLTQEEFAQIAGIGHKFYQLIETANKKQIWLSTVEKLATAYGIEAWDDGNPYYFDSKGEKHYAYHPAPEVNLCIGNDSPHLCLDCGKEFMADSEDPVVACPKCQSSDIVHTFELEGQSCPYCKKGEFESDPDYDCIS